MTTPGTVRIGISGWTYKPWRGVFYPEKLPHNRELAYAAKIFPSIEVNGTFYSLQRPSSFERWVEETPPDFVFAIKGSRYITHLRRLTAIESPLANFFASGILALGAKLGPILWQFAPNFRFDAQRFDAFLQMLPRDTAAASRLASRHDSRMSGRASFHIDRNRPLRHAVEIRHPSFVTEEFVALLRSHKVALVCADAVEWPRLMDLTADFVYCRLHGSEVLYSSGYGDAALDEWAERVVAWARGRQSANGEFASSRRPRPRARRDVYVFFDNDAKVRAPHDALGLSRRVCSMLEAGEP